MNIILVFAKAPVPGRVKTRLCPPLSPEAAAGLHAAFSRDTFEACRRVRGAVPWLAYEPHPEHPRPSWLGARTPEWVPQARGNLGRRLAAAFARAFSAGARRALAIGTDCPQLGPRELAAALRALESRDLVLGPAEDGGYYLIGLKAPAPALFRGISWSTPRVLAQTRRRAAGLGLTLRLLPRLRDVDTWEDLRALARTPAGRRARAALTNQGVPRKLLKVLQWKSRARPSRRADRSHAGTPVPGKTSRRP